MNTKLLTSCFALAALAGSASAAILVQESFSQTVGGLDTQAGGTGLNAWTATADYTVQSPTLNLGDLSSAGNQLFVSGNQVVASATTTSSIAGNDGTSIWFSLAVSTEGFGSGDHSGFAFGSTNVSSAFNGINLNGDGLGLYFRQGKVYSAAWTGGTRTLSGSSHNIGTAAGVPSLIVGHMEWGATEQLTIYNVSFNDLDTLGTGISVSTAGFDQSLLDTVSLSVRGTSYLFDEIRFGDTFADVSPVPEPSSFALLAGFFGLAWVMVRRRG